MNFFFSSKLTDPLNSIHEPLWGSLGLKLRTLLNLDILPSFTCDIRLTTLQSTDLENMFPVKPYLLGKSGCV